jgi:DNA-binding response OmpR family regulator
VKRLTSGGYNFAMAQTRKINIVLYSDDSTVRAAVKSALGRSLSPEMGEHQIREFATAAALRLYVDGIKPESANPVDIFILDGEAAPEGGMGVARQLKDEVFNCPPVLLLVARKEDAWLAAWSRAEASVTHPVDPFTLANTVADLVRTHHAAAIAQ